MFRLITFRKPLIIFIAIISAFFFYSLKDLYFDFSFEGFYRKGDPEAIFYSEYKARFAEDQNFMISMAIKSPQKDVFNSAFLVEVDSIFKKIGKLEGVDSLISGTSFTYPKRLAMGGYKEIPYLRFETEEEIQSSQEKLQEDTTFIGTFITKDRQYICAHFFVKPEIFDTPKRDKLSAETEKILQSSKYEYILTGMPYIRSQYGEKLKFEAAWFTFLGVLIMSILLWLLFQNVWINVITLITVAIGDAWTYGLMASQGQPITLVTNMLIAVILVVGVSDVIHITSKYITELKLGHAREEAMRITLDEIGFATFLTCITTATGFASLALSDAEWMQPLIQKLGLPYVLGEDIPPLRTFGLYGAFGVLITYFVSIILIPNAYLLIPAEKIIKARSIESSEKWEPILIRLYNLGIHYPKRIMVTFAFLAAISIYFLFQIPTNIHLMEELKDNDPVRVASNFFEKNIFGTRPFDIEFTMKDAHKATDKDVLIELEKIQNYLSKNPDFHLFISPVTFMKSGNYIYHFNRPQYFTLPDSQHNIQEIVDYAEINGNNYLRHILTVDGKKCRMSARTSDLGSEVHAGILKDLEAFIQKNCNKDLFEYHFTGYGYLSERSLSYLSSNLMNGLIIDFLIIGLVMGLVFRSFRMVIISMIPNMIPLLMTAGIMGMLGITLSASSALVFVVVFGIAVDDTIHFMAHYRMERLQKGIEKEKAIYETLLGTGKAIVLTSIILLCGFGTLVTSSFGSSMIMGIFCIMTLFFAVLTDLFLTPVILRKWGK